MDVRLWNPIISLQQQGFKYDTKLHNDSIEFYGSADESAEMQSTNEACSLAGTSTSTSCSQSTESAASSSVSRTRKRKSWTWLHFDEIGTSKTCKCKYCPTTFLISGTGTMSKHMHTKHSDMIGITNLATAVDGEGIAVKAVKYDVAEAHKAFLEFIVKNSHAFTLGEEPSFRNFISKLHPSYRPLGGTAVKDRLMKTYIAMKHKVTEKIGRRKVAFTTDLWTTPRMSLNPEPIEALVCLRSWYRAGLVNGIEVDEFIEDMHNN